MSRLDLQSFFPSRSDALRLYLRPKLLLGTESREALLPLLSWGGETELRHEMDKRQAFGVNSERIWLPEVWFFSLGKVGVVTMAEYSSNYVAAIVITTGGR